MSEHFETLLMTFMVAAVGLLSISAAVRLLAVRKPMIVPVWSNTLLMFLILLPALLDIGIRSRGSSLRVLPLLALIGVLVLVHRANRGYYVLGAVDRCLREAIRAALRALAFEFVEGETWFQLPSFDHGSRISLRPWPGAMQVQIEPWRHRSTLRNIMSRVDRDYRTRDAMISASGPTALIVGGLICLILAVMMYWIA